MSWYNLGTVTLTTGSAIVDGAGTAFVGNAIAGQALLTPDGRLMEIAEVISATRLRLVRPYAGGSVAGVAYDIIPTSADLTTVIERLNTLITRYRVVVDGVGQGRFPEGSAAAPAIGFSVDPDTGFMRPAENTVDCVTGGVQRTRVSSDGFAVLGGFLNVTGSKYGNLIVTKNGTGSWFIGGSGSEADNDLTFRLNDLAPAVRIDQNGNLLVGTSSGPCHTIARGTGDGVTVLNVSGQTAGSATFYSGGGAPASNAATAMKVAASAVTGRSMNAAGTVNTQGVDYAEYMTKAAGCGTIAKGDVCGVDRDGLLTRTWADAISFVIKSTNPSYVGGDIWGRSVGPRPEGPGEEPAAPIAPPSTPASEDEPDVAAWQAIVAAYPAQVAAYQSAHAAWTDAKAAYDTALSAWEAALEVARQKVDRIAFSGQVPVNVSGDFAVGDYIIASASGAGIKAVAVPAEGIPLDVYLRRVGKVWAVRDGRAWVDVQHG